MTSPDNTTDAIWAALQTVMDPEIPVISVVDLGIVRQVERQGERVVVTITPTFAGCPALDVMRREIAAAVQQLGFDDVELQTSLSPPWTTDWISTEGRDKLRSFGLAPPPRHGGALEIIFYDQAECPRCGGTHTALRNAFGSTLCRAIYSCLDCQETFEQFKPL